MSRRTRLTASAPPAIPSQDGGHPAATDDPGMDDYKNGDTSSWAEDPHPGPYPNSPEPQIPNEGHDHPAGKRAALLQRQAEAKKAGRCVRIAQLLLGKTASEWDIENQAVSFMDLTDAQVGNTLDRLAGTFLAEDFGQSGNSAYAEEAAPMAPVAQGAGYQTYAADEDADVEAMIKAMEEDAYMEEPMMDEPMMEEPMMEDDLDMEEQMMLSEMMGTGDRMASGLDEEEMGMLAEMMHEQAMRQAAEAQADETPSDETPAVEKQAGEEEDEEEEEEEEKEEEKDEEKDEEEEMEKEASGIVLQDEFDVLSEVTLSDADRAIMASLFPEVTEEVVAEPASKEASRRPTERKPSKGVQAVGAMNRVASDEITELSKMWNTDPDVSDYFNG